MNYYIKTLFGLFVTLLSLQTFGQPKSHIEHYGLSDGLPQRTVMSILQDKKGFMWFATWGGLCKFDGYTFTTYKSMSDDIGFIKNNRIDKIKEDSYGRIWTYTAYTKEAYRFDPRTEKYVTSFYIGGSVFQTSEIQVMHSGKVWLISNTMGAICIPDTTTNYYAFTKENNSLKSNNVNSVFEDSQLTSWILTDNGIVRVKNVDNQNKREMFLSSDEKEINSFFSSYETETEIWFGANKGRIICFNKSSGRFKTFYTGVNSEIISIKNIYDNLVIILTSKDGFFICDKDKSNLNKFDKDRLKELPTNEINSCFIDSKNNIWLELGGFKVAKFDLASNLLKSYESEVFMRGDLIYSPKFSILEDKSGRVWIHPRGGGFSYYDKTRDRLLPFFNNPLSPNWKFSHILHAMYIDKQGNLWISTRSEGVEKITFDDGIFKKSNFEEKKSELNFEIRAFYEDSDNNIWLGSKEGHVVIYDSKKNFKGYLSVDGNISISAPPLKLMAYTIVEDSKKNIWIGSKGNGLFLLKANKKKNSYLIKNYTHNPIDTYSLSNNGIYSVHEDNDGNIWIGTLGGGLNLYDEANNRFFNHSNKLNNYPLDVGHEIRAINSRNSVIYLATTLGLISFTYSKEKENPFSYKIYSKTNNGLRANDIYSVYKTKNNELYLATGGGGLILIEDYDSLGFPSKFKTYDTTNKLPSDFILSVIEDKSNKLWIVSEGDVFAFDPQSGQIERFNDVARILENNFFSEALPLLTHNGEILLGCTQGTLSFIPENIKIDDHTPYLSFSQFRVSGKDYISKGELEYIERISLNHNENNFTIEYAALDYENPQGILYAYKLDGLDNKWTYNQKQRLVNYTNLPPGQYTFRVKSTNSNGIWTSNERTLNIEVTPSFWQTKWAWLLYIISFILVLFVVLRSIFVFYRMRDKMRLEQEQTEMRTRFFTDISHEIRTPLTLILSPIEDIIERDRVLPDAKPQLQLVLKNTNRMLNMVNQILDFRKIQKQKLHVTEIELGHFVENLCHNFIATTEGKNINLIVDNQIASEKVWVDTDNIEKLVFNLVSNAIKHTIGHEKIEVNIFKKDKTYALQVKDEGEGMSKEIQSKLFTRFTSFNTDKSKPSTGIGLSIVKEIVDKHHAKITVDSNINKGSVFTVFFQSGTSHFIDDPNVEIIASPHENEKEDSASLIEIDKNPDATKDELLSILVVEDDADLRNFIKSVLSPYYNLYEASNGKEGYDATIKYIPDFILSDIMMPEMDGIELVQKIRSNTDTSHIPFIFLTAKTNIDDELEGIVSGANDYITKPFNVRLLKAKIENILKQRKLFSDQVTNASTTNMLSEDNTESFFTAYDEEFLKNVTNIIYSNIDNSELVIDNIVSETNISRKIFYKKIKSLTGLTPVEFLREVRIKRAAHLILSEEYMIKEIAYMVGFTDLKYFSRCFKQICGVIPSEYRRQHNRESPNHE